MLPPSDQKEHAALIERIIQFKAFVASPDQCKLLRFLYKNRLVRLQAKEIEEQHYKYPPNHPKHDQGHSRERIADLKARLCEYVEQAQGDIWRCNLPDAKRREGYQLEFKPVEREASQLFWKPHLEMAGEVFVVCGSHLFFHDPSKNSALRYYDFNVDRDAAETLERFKVAHPEAFKPDLQPWYHSYLSSGEVHAYEAMQRWFHGKSGAQMQRLTSRETPESKIHKSSPILLGRPDTNKFIRKIMDSRQAGHLGYRIHSTLGAIKIAKPEDSERQTLAAFPLTKDGILGPVPTWERVFGLVTRLRNPSGYGFVTIISADSHGNVVTQIVEALTKESLTKGLLAQTNWSLETDLPESFEMLFSVELSPGGLEGEGQAKLLCWRSYPKAS